jgi:hypothetical protein
MHCLLAGVGRYDGMVQRPPEPDGSPPPEVELVSGRQLVRTDPQGGEVYAVDVIVFRFAGLNPDGIARYTRDRDYTEERPG